MISSRAALGFNQLETQGWRALWKSDVRLHVCPRGLVHPVTVKRGLHVYQMNTFIFLHVLQSGVKHPAAWLWLYVADCCSACRHNGLLMANEDVITVNRPRLQLDWINSGSFCTLMLFVWTQLSQWNMFWPFEDKFRPFNKIVVVRW